MMTREELRETIGYIAERVVEQRDRLVVVAGGDYKFLELDLGDIALSCMFSSSVMPAEPVLEIVDKEADVPYIPDNDCSMFKAQNIAYEGSRSGLSQVYVKGISCPRTNYDNPNAKWSPTRMYLRAELPLLVGVGKLTHQDYEHFDALLQYAKRELSK